MVRRHRGCSVPFLVNQPQRAVSPAFLAVGTQFTADAAERVIAQYGNIMSVSPEGPVTSSYDFAVLRWQKEAAWLFRLLSHAVQQTRAAFPFAYSGFSEPLLLMRFSGHKKSAHGWQMDCGRGSTSNRKLTLVVELSHPEDYEGGEIEVHGPDGPRTSEQRDIGEVLAWPSYAVHRMLPVTSGERWALKAHLTGPAFV